MRALRRAVGGSLMAGILLCAGLIQPVAAQAADPGFSSGPSGPGAGIDITDPSGSHFATASLINSNGAVVGDLVVIDSADSAFWIVSTTGVSAGLHGLQVHTVGKCQSPFATAGDRVPGIELPPISVGSDGSGLSFFSTPSAALPSLNDADGFSVIVDELPDNRANIPARYQQTGTGQSGPDATTKATGDVGAPIACAVGKVETGRSRTAIDRRVTRARVERARRAALPRATGPIDLARADLIDAKGTAVGRVEITPIPGQQGIIDVDATGLTPGVHALQFHATGRCAGPDFTSSGARLADVDLPDLVADSSGSASASFSAPFPALASLLAGDGTAVVVHSGPDNHQNIPSRYKATGSSVTGPDSITRATGDAGANSKCGRLRTVPLAERYIEAVYQNLLFRGPTRAEVAKWTIYLAHHPRGGFVVNLNRGIEARAAVVVTAYLDVIGNPPGDAQLKYWVEQLGRRGSNELTLISNLLGSATLFEQFGNDNGDYIVGTFGFALGRGPSKAEKAIWNAYLSNGGRRSNMANALLRSTEARTGEITGYYEDFTGDDPNTEEVDAWLAFFRAGGDGRTMRAFLLGGTAFYTQATVSLSSLFGEEAPQSPGGR